MKAHHCVQLCKCNVIVFFAADECSNYEAKRLHLDNLYRMVQYCENRTDCRRSQLLQYFSEIFDKSLCRRVAKATCDNCGSKVVNTYRSMTFSC